MTHAPSAGATRSTLVLIPLVTLAAVATGAVLAAQQAAPPAGFPAQGQPAIVKLLTPGAAPRTRLRYAVPPTYREHMTMRMQMSMAMDMAGASMPEMAMPTMNIGADLTMASVSPSGDMTYDLAFTGMQLEDTPGVNPAVSAALQGLDADYKTLKGRSTVSNRGVPVSNTLDFSKVSNPQLKQSLDSISSTLQTLSMPLPEEAVGVGAKWEVRQALASGGVQSYQKAAYEITAITATGATIKTTIEQTAPAQAVSNPALPPGADVQLQSLNGTGTGTVTLRFDALVPTSEATMENKTVMAISMNGASQTVGTTMSIHLSVGTKK